LDFNGKVNILINFLKAVENVLLASLNSADKLSNAAFFQALFGEFKTIAMLTRERHGDYKTESFQKTLHPLENIAWDYHSGTNHQSIVGLSKHIVDLIW
jgi:hypothetical protein